MKTFDKCHNVLGRGFIVKSTLPVDTLTLKMKTKSQDVGKQC